MSNHNEIPRRIISSSGVLRQHGQNRGSEITHSHQSQINNNTERFLQSKSDFKLMSTGGVFYKNFTAKTSVLISISVTLPARVTIL